MPLLLLWHPRVGGTPTPSTPEIEPPKPLDGGGINPRDIYLRRKKRIAQDDDELIEILGIVAPLIVRNR